VQGGDGGRLDRDNLSPACHGRRHTSEQATTADGDHDDLDVRVVVEELFGARTRAGGDLGMVVGVTEQIAAVAGEADGRPARLGDLAPMRCTCAPYAAIRCTFTCGAAAGTNTVAGIPSCRAA
jgi:hypothetical protein